ncbi:MAG: glycosyl hydrolase [Rhodocyclales bacterium]|nr:glycosyl hydrolase [Rhodocyclales bacterium]
MKKTIIYLCLAGLSAVTQAAPPDNAPLPPAPRALDHPATISGKAVGSAMLAVARAGDRLLVAGERGIVLYSIDHGKTWIQASTPTSVTLTALRFVDDRRGWAVGHMGIVLHTDDGGATWHKQLDGLQAAQLAYATAMRSGDEKAIRQATYLLTDGPDKPFFDIHIDPSGHGFIIGAYNLIFRTSDGGKHWEDWSARVDNPRNLHLYGIAQVGSAIYLVGEQGLILRSTDGGQYFAAASSPYPGSWFGALSTRQGLLLYGLRGNAFRLPADGGNWQALQTNSAAAISGATELSDGRLLLASQSGQLLIEEEARKFVPLAMRSSTPLTAVIEDGNQGLLVASLRGVLSTPIASPNN